MRRSKSDPSKYARNYRNISQRRMTSEDAIDETAEIERLRSLLRESKAHLEENSKDKDTEETKKKKRKRSDLSLRGEDAEEIIEEQTSSLLSPELLEELGDEANVVVTKTKKTSQKSQRKVVLTSQEIKQAKAMQKKTARKIAQLEQRAISKQKRAKLYDILETSKFEATELLVKTSELGKKQSQKQQLLRLVQKERAGLPLSTEERDRLYKRREISRDETDHFQPKSVPSSLQNQEMTKSVKKHVVGNVEQIQRDNDRKGGVNPSVDDDEKPKSKPKETKNSEAEKSATNLAAQMMASLASLRQQCEKKQSEKEIDDIDQTTKNEEDENRQKTIKKSIYVPNKPVEIKTTQSYEKIFPRTPLCCGKSGQMVREIQRPTDVVTSRNELPVVEYEFEVMDAIRNHDVTILCAETGSGKSTQVPQFLFEAGFSQSDALSAHQCMIGVTQPRRVAAVSTAKRVCYEIGCGDGQKIAGRQGNMVAYQTRYETAGLGIDTHIKFMTDGILLQEIQSDLLLRKYSVIVLDEAHERNLNTDVLIGLISAALPLRKKASEEKGSNVLPLKVIIMSATLRVEDFTENKNLFPTSTVKVVKVPGRTFPVTVHHSRVTELDDYEDAVFRKTCKIHRQLPQGGILVFLTGKHEIIRMVNRLRRAFSPKSDRSGPNDSVVHDLSFDADVGADEGLRDQDDEEIDADLFRRNDVDDFDDIDEDQQSGANFLLEGDTENGIPQKALVLPLYSLLSPEEQAKVFAPVPEGHRLIVVATNIAETSISIPGLSYVVDSGRQKCRNYHAETGIASYDIMWISKAAADQRSGRAGRCGPGHCYRLYSSSLYSRYMDAFALPEILTRPLEDIVLAMKAMKVTNVSNFPFPTPPDRSQIEAALKLLANISCVDLSGAEGDADDGKITRLGTAVSRLPLGVRYGKILLVAAQAGVLDYAIVVVAALSESSPFVHTGQTAVMDQVENDDQDSEKTDDELESRKIDSRKWHHKGGDMLAAMLAAGAYAFAGRGAGGASEKLACSNFCEENGLHPVVMERIHKMRKHLARLAKTRLGNASGVAASTGGFVCTMAPPNKLQERLLLQAIGSGFLDNIAVVAPPGSISGDYKYSLRTAYLSCSSTIKEPLFLDRNSVLFSRDTRLLPQWVCYEGIVRKKLKDGKSFAVMKNVSPVDPSWLGLLAKGSRLLTLEEPIESPIPYYDPDADAIMCSVRTKFGLQKWEIPPIPVVMYDALQTPEGKRNTRFMSDDSFRWFARYLFEGKVLPQLNLTEVLNDAPSIITRNTPVKKVALVVSALSGAGVDSAAALRRHWAEVNDKFLFGTMKAWIKLERVDEFKQLWISTVKENVRSWKEQAD